MIKHVLDKCMEVKNNADLILCTDDVDLMNLSKEWDINLFLQIKNVHPALRE